MNEENLPPKLPQPAMAGVAPITWTEEEQQPLQSLGATLESMLRQPRRVFYQLQRNGAGRAICFMALISILCSAVYGVVVGTFSGGTQLWASPVKIVGGLLVSGVICLPSLYIFGCLSGAKVRLAEVAGLVAGAVALMSLLLIGFAPVAWIFSQSTNSVVGIAALHLLFWAIALYFGLRFLDSAFEDRRAASGGIRLWSVIFLLVMLQMTTALRPLIGEADTFFPTEKKFFVKHWADTLDGATRANTR